MQERSGECAEEERKKERKTRLGNATRRRVGHVHLSQYCRFGIVRARYLHKTGVTI